MNFFRKIVGLKEPISTSPVRTELLTSSQSISSGELLKLATQQKKDQDLKAAIDTLKVAYAKIKAEGGGYGADTYLRLPKYLLLAGRNDEAWAECNRALTEGFNGNIPSQEMIFVDHSMIYSVMANQLAKEKKFFDAAIYSALSFILWERGMMEQKRKSEASLPSVKEAINSLLSKAKKEDLYSAFITEFDFALKNIKTFQVSALVNRLHSLIVSK